MTTALQIISRAAEIIGYKDADEALSGNDANNFLGVLNAMVDAWNTDRLYIPATQTVSASVSASPVSIGAGQTLNTTRPVRIESAWVRLNGVDYDLAQISQFEYDAIPAKATVSTIPNELYYSATLPSGSIYLYPVPAAPVSLFVRVTTQLTEFADAATDYSLAPGYRKALEYSLAEELAVGRAPLNPKVERIAANARRAIKVANFQPVLLSSSDVERAIAFNILTD